MAVVVVVSRVGGVESEVRPRFLYSAPSRLLEADPGPGLSLRLRDKRLRWICGEGGAVQCGAVQYSTGTGAGVLRRGTMEEDRRATTRELPRVSSRGPCAMWCKMICLKGRAGPETSEVKASAKQEMRLCVVE